MASSINYTFYSQPYGHRFSERLLSKLCMNNWCCWYPKLSSVGTERWSEYQKWTTRKKWSTFTQKYKIITLNKIWRQNLNICREKKINLDCAVPVLLFCWGFFNVVAFSTCSAMILGPAIPIKSAIRNKQRNMMNISKCWPLCMVYKRICTDLSGRSWLNAGDIWRVNSLKINIELSNRLIVSLIFI